MKIVVTAGPTREFLDPVRFLSNRSTGRMGYAIAEVAVARGHAVRLVSGPVALEPPEGVSCVPVISAAEMLQAVLANLAWADVLVMCAAVADWRPCQIAPAKLKKDVMQGTLQLERTQDILAAVKEARRADQYIVGFAAETDHVEGYAREKLNRKGLDLIVANDVSRADAGFAVDTNVVTLMGRDCEDVALPLLSKREVAARLLARIEADCQSGDARRD
jgi:phosphopantothenoylcysteine decarboxylase / phosphopantothenate---cysteine ligase